MKAPATSYDSCFFRGRTLLEIRNVINQFGRDVIAVNDVSMNLTNGAGKTTLMQMITTLTRPTRT